ncbi:hypothetical protein [Acuticoccus sp.]|uniref:hypothetical protein n=1 Tax=Acuticoccus sp. TaxID=1904378 RepID=UPI003B529EAE
MNPSNWYPTGFIAPSEDAPDASGAIPADRDRAEEEEADREVDEERAPRPWNRGAPQRTRATTRAATERVARQFVPSSIGLTVRFPRRMTRMEADVT